MSATTANPEFEGQRESLWQTISPVVVLTLICLAAAACLAGVKIGTAVRIEDQILSNIQGPSLQRLFPAAGNDMIAERKKFTLSAGSAVTVFPVYEKGVLSAVAIEGLGQGYGGDLGVMAGFNLNNGSLRGIAITVTKETPGIGSQVGLPRYTKQFAGRSGKIDLRSNGGQIDAVSGATISSRGAIAAVQMAVEEFDALKEEIAKAWPAQGGGQADSQPGKL